VRPQATGGFTEQIEAEQACDRPGLEGGVNFWDYWREHRRPDWGMFGDDGL
jgi:hypothetical protein